MLLTPSLSRSCPAELPLVPGMASLSPLERLGSLLTREQKPLGTGWLMLGWMSKTNLQLFFCDCQSALMHQHHQLHHTTSSHEQLQGAARVIGCLPSGLPPARPRPRGCLPGRERSLSLCETDCDLTSTFRAAPSLQQLQLCLTSQPRQ